MQCALFIGVLFVCPLLPSFPKQDARGQRRYIFPRASIASSAETTLSPHLRLFLMRLRRSLHARASLSGFQMT